MMVKEEAIHPNIVELWVFGVVKAKLQSQLRSVESTRGTGDESSDAFARSVGLASMAFNANKDSQLIKRWRFIPFALG